MVYFQCLISLFGSLLWFMTVKAAVPIITIGYLQNGTAPNLGLDEMLVEVNSKFTSSVNFKIKYFDFNKIKSNSYELLGTDAMFNVSIMLARRVPVKISQSLTKILQVPLITTELTPCHSSIGNHEVNCANEFLISVGLKQLSSSVLQFMKKIEFKSVTVVFQTKRVTYLNVFMNNIGGSLVSKIFPVETDYKGQISSYSIEKLKSLEFATENLIVLIYEEDDLPHFFQLLRSNQMNICHRRVKMVYFGLAFFELQNVCNRHTLMGLQIQKVYDSYAMGYGANVDALIQRTRSLQDILLFDALFITANITTTLLDKGLWLPLTGPNQQSARTSNSANFTATLQKTKFHGVTGQIEFDNNMDRVHMTLNVVNTQDNYFKKIGEMNGDSMKVTFDESPRENIPYQIDDLQINGHLIAVTIVDEPFTFAPSNASDSSSYTGFCIDILKELAKNLNFTYSIYVVKDGEYGRNNNGTWTGMVGDVLYKKADIAIASLTVTSSREEVVQFTKPYMELQHSYVRQRQTLLKLDYFQHLKPFTTTVWLIILFGAIFAGLILYAVDYFSPFGWRQVVKGKTGDDGTEFNASNSIWFTFASSLLQGGDNTPRTLSGRVLVGTLWFAILIVTSSYTANMAAYFTFSKSLSESENIESLLKAGVSFSIRKNTALDQYLQSSDYKVYKLLAERITQQQKYAKDVPEGIAKVKEDPNLLYIGEGPYPEWLINKGDCNLKMVNGIFPSRSYGFPVRKGSPISEKISIGISQLVESNFIQERINYYWKELSKCKNNAGTTTGITEEGRIEPIQLLGVYGCLVIGIVVSIVALILEIWWKRTLKEKKRKVTMMVSRATTLRFGFSSKESKASPSSFPRSITVKENAYTDYSGDDGMVETWKKT